MRKMLSQRRRHSRWRMFLVPLVFLALIRQSELAPPGISESSSQTSAATKKSQNLGSLSDFTWQAWLLVDTQTGSQSGMDSSLFRRITPKSVFIAPALPACADGYRADTMNRCVKSVNIDENAHFSFLLQRLNALYGNQNNNPQAANSKNEQKQSTGPLQLNIPLIPNSKPQSTKIELAEMFSMNDPIAAHEASSSIDDDKTKSHEATATAYDTKSNATSNKERESIFFLGNSSVGNVADKVDEKSDAVVPVAEFVEEANSTSFSEIVDYKIPINLKTLFNASNMKKLDASNIEKEGISMTDKLGDNSTEISPTLVLLLSPTRLPSTVVNPEMDDSLLAQNDTVNYATLQMSNLTSNATTKETVGVNTPQSDESTLTWKLSESPIITIMDKDRSNETHAEDTGSEPESTKLSESRETEFVYDEEEEDDEYPYSTDMPDEESTESEEEILKHGEAGMTIPSRNIEWLHRDQQQQQQQQNQTKDEEKADDSRNQVVIRFNDTALAVTDEVGSNISSEVSIDGDVILETTLLDVNTERLQVTTNLPDFTVTRKVVMSIDDKSSESREEDRSTAPEIMFLSQDTHGATSTGSHGYKSVEHLASVEKERREESEVALSSSDSLYDSPMEDPITEIYAIDKDRQSDAVRENASETSSKDSGPVLRTFEPDVNSFKPASMNLGATENFIRFPDQVARQLQDDYVRFPSNEANSIHTQNYKQHYPTNNNASYDGTSMKSNMLIRQKPSVYHPATPSWKLERQQPLEHVPAVTAVKRQRQQPTLFHFWSKMPLVRDPAIYPVHRFPTNRSNDQVDEQPRDRFRRSSSRSLHTKMPSRDDNKVLVRKRRRAPTRD